MSKVMTAFVFLLVGIFGLSSIAAAETLVLVAVADTGTLNTAIFTNVDNQSTGTGVIDPFLRLQANGSEFGYNTDGDLEFDSKPGPFTSSLLLSDVPIVNIAGTDYREFLLDINQVGEEEGANLFLTDLELYLGSTGDLTGYPALGTKVYDLDSNEDNTVHLNYSLNPGSGAGDLFVYIPDSYFTGPNQYLYLYSGFNGSNDGFEEWAIREATPQVVPEPGSIALVGTGLLGIARAARRRFRKNQPIA